MEILRGALPVLCLAIWLLVIPFGMGLFVSCVIPGRDRTPGAVFITGYLLLLALFELAGIPVVLLVTYDSFTLLSRIFMALSIAAAAAGFVLMIRKTVREEGYFAGGEGTFGRITLEEGLYWLLFLALLGFQLYMAFTRASFDGDDAYYGAQGTIAVQMDSLYRINPYTGRSAPLDVRHALALFPIWEAFIAGMSGIHPVIVMHSVMPLLLIPLTYLLYFRIGKELFGRKRIMLPVFMILMALFQIFGNVSVYTNETFFLTRTWQGKSVAGNFILPAVFWIFLNLFDDNWDEWPGHVWMERTERENRGYFLVLACLNLAAGAASSLAVLLSCLLTAGLGLLFAVRYRKFGVLVRAGLACVPGAAYVLTYLVIR
ncbi:MAG: hypothetical protein K2P71_11600 [Lachnospiraceae bacterium]|nr:hypothetical protein [Lachnospiraceae bacterium]MDE6816652.1 hypothetical protein [Lachnospiraceae bacterium]